MQRLKKRLAAKEGLPESQQRLIFSVSSAENCIAAPAAEKAAEEIVGELHSWQVSSWNNLCDCVHPGGQQQ